MTISASNRNDAIGSGSTATYPFGYKIFAATDLRVTVRDPDSDAEYSLTYPTHFSVTGVGLAAGGNIVLAGTGNAWQDGSGYLETDWPISIRRVRPLTQETDIKNQGDYRASVHEDTFDKLTMIDQQQQDELDRSLKFSESVVLGAFNAGIPAPVAGAFPRVNVAGTGLEWIAASPDDDTFTQSGTGAVARSWTAKVGDQCHLFDFIEPGLHAAIVNHTSDEDVTSEFANAIAEAVGRELILPGGLLNVSNIVLDAPVILRGQSVAEAIASGKTMRGTRLLAIPGSTGGLISIDRGSTYWNDENNLYGVGLKSLFLDGNGRSVDISALDMSRVDRLVVEDVNIQHFKYQALRFNTSVRESWFNRVRTRFCGSIADDKPCIDLREQSTTNDAHNNVWFQDCQIVYSLGTSVHVAKAAGSSTTPRSINFLGGFVHGLVPAVDTVPYTFSTNEKQLKLLYIGDVDQTGSPARINSVGTRWFSAGGSVSSIHLSSDADNAVVTITGGEVGSHYASAGNYDGIQVEAGVLLASAAHLRGHNKPINQTGGEVYLSPDVYMTGNAANPVFFKNATAVRNPVFLPRFSHVSLPAATLFDDGTLHYASDIDMAVVSTGAAWNLIPRVGVGANVGDASKVLAVTDVPTWFWNTAITTDITVTLPANASSVPGMKFRIIRRAGATGAFNLTVQDATPTTIKVLAAAGVWVDVEYVSGAWIETAYGSL